MPRASDQASRDSLLLDLKRDAPSVGSARTGYAKQIPEFVQNKANT